MLSKLECLKRVCAGVQSLTCHVSCYFHLVKLFVINMMYFFYSCRSQWPCGLRRGSAAARLLRLWVRIPPGRWTLFCCELCVLAGRGLCDELITRPEEPFRLWCVVVCDLETSLMGRPWPSGGPLRQNK